MDNDISKVLYIATKLYEKFIPLLTAVPLVLFDDEDLENFAKENNLKINYENISDLNNGKDVSFELLPDASIKIYISTQGSYPYTIDIDTNKPNMNIYATISPSYRPSADAVRGTRNTYGNLNSLFDPLVLNNLSITFEDSIE